MYICNRKLYISWKLYFSIILYVNADDWRLIRLIYTEKFDLDKQLNF